MKKIVCLLVVIGMSITAFSGCGNKDNTKKDGSIPKITWYIQSDKQEDMPIVMEKANSILKEKVGCSLDLQCLDAGSYSDKMTMMIASNANMDMCFTSNWANKFLPNVEKGAYLDITKMIDEEAPKLKSDLPDYLYNAAKVNGKIYAVPNLQVLFYQRAFAINKELADKYKLDITKLKAGRDIEPFLETIKQNEPNKYPIKMNHGLSMFDSEYENIDGTLLGVAIKRDSTDYKVCNYYASDIYKKAIDTASQWYKKGYIRSDVNSIMDDSSEEKAQKYAVTITTYKPGGEQEFARNKGYEAYIVPLEEAYLQSTAGMSTMTAILKQSKNPKLALKVLELVNTDKEFYNLITVGIDDIHYTKEANNKISLKEGSKYNLPGWMLGNQFNSHILESQDADVWEQTKDLNNKSKKSPLAGFVFDTTNVKAELSQLSTVNGEYGSLFNGSEPNTDKRYKDYLERVKVAGIDKIVEEVQKQINNWKK